VLSPGSNFPYVEYLNSNNLNEEQFATARQANMIQKYSNRDKVSV
jgi:hypothetical protein